MPAPAIKLALVASPILAWTTPVWAAEAAPLLSTTALPLIALGACALGGVGFALSARRRKSQIIDEASRHLDAAEQRTGAALQALDALLLDRADGAAIWSGRGLEVAIGAAEVLSDLDDAAPATDIAGRLAAPAFVPKLSECIEALIDSGTPFEQAVNAVGGGSRTIVGRTLGGRALLSIVEGDGAGRALTADEARLRRAGALQGALSESFDHAPLIAWRRNEAGHLTWANKAYIEAVEAADLSDTVERKLELVFGDDAKLVTELAERARTVGRPQTERATTVINGSRRTLEFREIPVVAGTLGFATDVTAQVVAADALRRQIEANELTLDRLHRGVAVFSTDLTLSYFNDAVAKLWGIDAGWLQGNPSLREILNALRERSKVPQARNFSTWRTETLDRYARLTDAHETHWHLPNGGVLHLVAQPHPLGGLLLVFEDVTDFFELKRDMATVSAVQKAALSRLREGVLVLGLDGRRRLSNKAFEAMWDLDDEILDNAHIREIATLCEPLYGDQGVWTRMIEFVSAATEARGTWHERLYRADNRVLAMASTVLPDGATMFAFTDITDSINKERALVEQNEKLEELSGLKSAFLDGIHGASQELKIPLNTIIGFTEILGQEIFGDLNERQREYIDGVATAANDLRVLVSGITDLAMIQADDFPFRVEPIHLKSVLDATVRFIERSVAEHVHLIVDCPGDIGEVPGDAPRFREILHNLINAVRADAGPDEVIEIGVRRREKWLELWVGGRTTELTGSNWSIFEDALNGLDAPPLRRDALGVTLSRQFVERQGGTVGLERGFGTTAHAAVCRFLTDEAHVRAAIMRERIETSPQDSPPDGWDGAGSASRA